MLASSRLSLYLGTISLAVATAVAGWAGTARAYDCTSSDPAQWPAPSKPYFMVAFDTSGSMSTNVTGNVTDSCGYGTTRTSHGKCAFQHMVQAYNGEVRLHPERQL